jgi:hypothetical protein
LCISILLIAAFGPPASKADIASCNLSFTSCAIPENVLLQLPVGFLAIAGDVVLTEPNGTTVSDVFRIFNNVINTGSGTGLGNMVLLFSSDEGVLPSPSTYSANVAFIPESPNGVTSYFGNGTTYLLATPEPSTLAFLSLAIMALAIGKRLTA